METRNEKHNGFANGFLLGMVLGVCLTLLFVTKRGRKILRALTAEGMDNIATLRNRLQKLDSSIGEDLYLDDLEEELPVASEKPTSQASPANGKREGNGVKKHSPKRLFRGIPKKS